MSFLVPAAVLGSVAIFWASCVSSVVTEPYLDEFFHVRQAQVYCADHFVIWDPKITTPPGLYLLSRILLAVTGRCDVVALRSLNTIGLILTLVPTAVLVGRITQARRATDGPSLITLHSALNVTLFPPLFFFSALYYTDVLSTILVLAHYDHTLKGLYTRATGFRHHVISVVLGASALLFRQTNIFWVAVFPAGLTAIQELKTHCMLDEAAKTSGHASADWLNMEDLDVADASVEDYLFFLVAVALGAMKKPWSIVKAITPYLFLIVMFAAFVAWNGGVVLGDKSNHIATIHVPQMLYIWPYMMFFSFPLTIPVLLTAVLHFLPRQYLPLGLQSFTQRPANHRILPRIPIVIAFVFLGLLAVKLNTIVHPFTLADNRHYVFYVFRLLLRHPIVKYVAVPIYIICAWLIIQSTGSGNLHLKNGQADSSAARRPKLSPDPTIDSPKGKFSFLIIWLATTALSVVTAPLVEPRYFIIPWAVWRINAAPIAVDVHDRQVQITKNPLWTYGILVCETLWLALINLGTGYMFLYRGFGWPQEPGKVQRFMW
ncbi:hypothetical protein EJ05DRAFT_498707 [Pseudovirgaria hyperparasitica]|uniref:Dol-P-Glc:Glc(2)Man(9)GlcNAc(2)-PP-Dol alpha-1,2-glucosyltransferase n=1 Tax=Pseudovirgaria hyperparasitica TaxID=470096 RepID=A0A6A6WCC1_9PEZI|nr:uncharacterized protein EJ05DRAFT_498707 [Pseudovirgaria hyperparasitica]KAF2759496.1 hypothetical protein EJ05DRAFT_498707 [Pseudovirgaria hyperparasitica]